MEIDVGLPASLLVAPRGCGQYPLCPLRRKFVQASSPVMSMEINGNAERLPDQRLAAVEGVAEFDFNAAKHHRLDLNRRPEHGNVEPEFPADGVSRGCSGCHPVGTQQQVAFQRIVRRIRTVERPRHRKPGIQASGEFGSDKFFRLSVFGAFLHSAPPAALLHRRSALSD